MVLAWANHTLATKDRDSLVVIATDQGTVGAAFRRQSLIYICQEETVSDAFLVLDRESDPLVELVQLVLVRAARGQRWGCVGVVASPGLVVREHLTARGWQVVH